MDHPHTILYLCIAYTGLCHLLLLKKQAADEGTGKCKGGEEYADGEVDREGDVKPGCCL